MKHQNKVAVITGASRGIGKAVALGLAKDGYHVCLLSRSKEALQNVSEHIKTAVSPSSPFEPLIYECDVTDIEVVNKVIKDIIHKLGHIDVLFNNAGILRLGSLEDVKGFNDMINVNLIGAFNVLHAVVPCMKQQKYGYIFNLSSLCGKIGYAGVGAYTASKFGLVGLSESLFNELAADNIKVTAICPSYVATDMVSHVENPPQHLMIQPDDIFQVVRGLLSLSAEACIKEITVYCKSTIISD